MIAQVDPTSIAPLLAGPAAAVVVLVLVLWGLYKLVVIHLIPLASKAIDRHLTQIDRLIETQRDESKGILKALNAIDRRLSRLEGGTDAGGPMTVTQIHPNPGAQSPDRGS